MNITKPFLNLHRLSAYHLVNILLCYWKKML